MVAAAVIGSAVVGAGASTVAASKAAKAQKKAAQTAAAAQKDASVEARKAAEEAAVKAQAAQEAAFKESQGIYGDMSKGAQDIYDKTYGDVTGFYNQAYDRSNAALRDAYNQQLGFQQPYRDAGLAAQRQQMMLMGLGGDQTNAEYGRYARDFGMGDFEQDPGYAFRQSEGMRALERSAAARGNLLSGSMLKGVQRFSQDLASQEYQNAFNRFQAQRAARMGALQNLNTAGQSASNVMTNAAGQYGSQRSATAQNLGQQLAQNRSTYGSASAGNVYNTAQLQAQNRLRFGDLTAQNANNVANAAMQGAYYAGNAAAQGAMNAGAARASGYVGAANAINQGIGGITNYMVQAPLYNAMADYYRGGASGGGAGFGNPAPTSNYSSNYLNPYVA